MQSCRLSVCILLFLCACGFLLAEENFFLVNGTTGESIVERGSHLDERVTPCSTFKIALSLMGYDAEVLKDAETPIWNFQKGYDDFLESWKAPQTPQSWMKHSCVWYSRVIAELLGMEQFQSYLQLFDYGNQDMSGGLTHAWISSSLAISTKEQVSFIQNIVRGELPISQRAIQMTKSILFIEDLPEGWKLFGKTGYGNKLLEIGWFVGWIEKDEHFFAFAYNIRNEHVVFSQRILRVKQLLAEAGIVSRE